jgi:hypothetical protein
MKPSGRVVITRPADSVDIGFSRNGEPAKCFVFHLDKRNRRHRWDSERRNSENCGIRLLSKDLGYVRLLAATSPPRPYRGGGRLIALPLGGLRYPTAMPLPRS